MKKAPLLILLVLLLCASTFAQDSTQTARKVVVGITNATVTGTTLHRLAKLSGAPSKALIVATTDTDGVLGVVTSGAGVAGIATIQTGGVSKASEGGGCDFDGATTAGDYISISSTAAGKCHDTGSSTYPTSGQVVGRVLSTNVGAGTYDVLLFSGPKAVNAVAPTRTINTTSPLTGGGDLSADRTLACATCEVTGNKDTDGALAANSDTKYPSQKAAKTYADTKVAQSSLGTGVATALGVNVGSAGSPVVNGGVGGTPSSLTLTSATGLPEVGLTLADNTTNDVGITKHGFAPKLPNDATKFLNGVGAWAVPPTTSPSGSSGDIQTNNGAGGFGSITPASGISTFLATPSSANLRSAITDESGTGALIFAGGAIGAATATSINGLTLTSSTGTFTLTNAKTFSVSNTLTLAGTDGSTLNVGAGGTLGSNAFTSTAYLPLTGGTLTGALLFSTDNTIDIGASGATRPRNIYIGTGAYFGTDIFVSRSGTNTFSVRNAANTGYNIFRASRFYASRDDDSLGADIGLGSVDVLRLGSAGGVSISSTANSNGSNDVAISRQGVGVLQVGTAIGNASGALYAANSKFGGTAVRGTTEGTNKVDIFDGTAPVGTLANGISLYSTAGELRVMDAAGNATLLSPHDHETNEWIFFSCNTVTGKCIRIDMEKAMRVLQAISGEKIITEWTEKPAGDASSKGKP